MVNHDGAMHEQKPCSGPSEKADQPTPIESDVEQGPVGWVVGFLKVSTMAEKT